MQQIGGFFSGSSQIETSKAGENIIPDNMSFYKYSFMNPEQNCTVSINESEPIFLQAGMGFTMDQVDARIHSFRVLENDIRYFWVGGR